jgi:single-strand DNA-binding protein
MNSINNSVQLIGSLGRDVEYRQLDNGRSVSHIKMATREVFRAKDGSKRIETTWHNVIAWGKIAETMQALLKKGSTIVVQGKLRNRFIGEAEKKQLYTEVVVNEFRLMHHSNVAAREEVVAV